MSPVWLEKVTAKLLPLRPRHWLLPVSNRPQLVGCPGLQVPERGYHFPLQEGNPPARGRSLWDSRKTRRRADGEVPPMHNGDTVALVPSPSIPLTVNFPTGLSVHVNEMGPCPLPTLPDPSSRIPDNCRLMGRERAAGPVSLSPASPQSPALVGTRGQSRRPAGGGGG